MAKNDKKKRNGKLFNVVSFERKLPLTTLATERTILFPFSGTIGNSGFDSSLNLFPIF
jgi:hypothetical protein